MLMITQVHSNGDLLREELSRWIQVFRDMQMQVTHATSD